MQVHNLDDADYRGTFMQFGERGGRAGKRKRSVSVLRKAPRGLHGNYARRSRKVAQEATVRVERAPQGTSYADRLAKFGAVGGQYD